MLPDTMLLSTGQQQVCASDIGAHSLETHIPSGPVLLHAQPMGAAMSASSMFGGQSSQRQSTAGPVCPQQAEIRAFHRHSVDIPASHVYQVSSNPHSVECDVQCYRCMAEAFLGISVHQNVIISVCTTPASPLLDCIQGRQQTNMWQDTLVFAQGWNHA